MTTSWKQLLTEAESLTKANGKNAWRTAQIVRDLFKSGDFLAEECGDKLDSRDSKLSKFSGRFAIGLNDMIQMIEHFPLLEDWKNGRLDILRDKTCSLLAKKTGRSKEKQTRNVVRKSDYEALKAKLREANIQIRLLREEVETLRKIAMRNDKAAVLSRS